MSVTADLKTFLTQPTFITLAVAFVVGTQVALVITALVSSIIDPAIGIFFHTNLTNAAVVTVNGSKFTFGALLGAILNFIIVLIVVFFVIVEPYAKYTARHKPTTMNCPFCQSTISIAATRCAFCTSQIPPPAPAAPATA
jgi:large conductance mechanosensitive channel